MPGQDNFYIKRDLESALREAETIIAGQPADEIFIFGGGEIYRQSLPQVDRIYLTRVHITVDNGDAFFPALSPENWQETERVDVENDTDPPHSYLVLDRISGKEAA